MIINLPINYYGDKSRIFKADSVDLRPGLSVLVGCNGAGKSTFLKILKDECKAKCTPFFSYDNLFEGGSNAKSKLAFQNNFSGLARNFSSSEGENISNNFADIAPKIGKFVTSNLKSGTIVLAFDAIDSGSSIDNIIEIKDFFKFVVSHEQGKAEIYIVVAANSYEFASGEQCVDITNGKYITFGDYSEYRNFVLKSREIKNKRYKTKRK